jgi:glyoxylase-like metal-dependent hydrolase (beta-lactamase superfamily II)
MIIEVETVGPFQENCYIMGDEKSRIGAIIDPGDEAERILKTAKSTGLEIKFILNTHAHLDHVCGIQEIKEALKIPFYLHKDDHILLQHLPKQAAMFGLRVDKVPDVDFFYGPNAVVDIGGLKARILHAPGHSPGSVCIHFESERVVFGGDVLFNGSIGRTDLYGGDFDTLIHSIRTHLFTMADETLVYPGHGPVTSIGHEKRYNPFLSENSGNFA